MKVQKTMAMLLIILGAFSFINISHAEQTDTSNNTIYIGIERNRLPFSHINDRNKLQGIIAKRLRDICNTINQPCEFIAKSWDHLLKDLQLHQLDTIVVADNIIIPDVDQVSLSIPICTMYPVFLIRTTAEQPKSIDDFQATTIGVRKGSTFHFHLLHEYSHLAKIKAYTLIENAIFDIAFDRLDSILIEQAFYESRIKKTPLGNKDNVVSLTHFPLDNISQLSDKYKNINITLATKKGNEKVINDLESILKEVSIPTPLCKDLAKPDAYQIDNL